MAQPPSSHASATGRLVPAALLAIVVLATVPGCREGGSSGAGAEVPVLDLAGVEVAVAEAIRAAQSAVIADPGSADAWGTLGMVLEAHGFDDAAATCYRQAADLDSSQVSWPYLAAHVLTRVDPAAAIPLFDRAVALDPRSALLRYVYGDALLQLGEEDAAAAEYERALQLDPKARRALLGLGEIALRQGDLDLARQRLDLAANLDFFDREVHAKLARLHRRRGDDEAAAFEALLVRAYPGLAPIADPYHAAVDRKATSVKALTERGLAAVASGRLDEAEQAFWSAMKIRPDSIRNRLNLAGVLARQGRFDDAVDMLAKVEVEAPSDPDVHNTWAVVLIEQRRFDLAAQHLREAIGVDPTHDEALMNFGRVLEAQGDMDRAIDAFRRALEVNPVNVPVHRGLATLLGRRGRAAEALEHWKHAALFGRFEPDATRRYAVAAAQLGRFGDALDALRQGLRRAPDDVPMIAAAVTILATCPLPEYRNGEAATQWAQRLIGRTGGRHVPSLNLLAAAQAERGDFAAATTTSERALALARAEGNTALAARIESRLALYRAERPYHQPLAPAPGPPRP